MPSIPKLKLDFCAAIAAPAELTSEQTRLVAELTAALPSMIDSVEGVSAEERAALTAWADSIILRQFLRATSWDLHASIKRLTATLKWRNEYKPSEITAEEVEPEANTGKQFISGFDKLGRPQLFLVPRMENTKTYDRQIRYSVYMLEKCIKLMPAGVERVTVLVDYEKLNIFNATPLSVSLKYMGVLSNHYPERLGVCVMVNASWYFSGFFKLLSPFLDPVTKSKLRFTKVKRGTAAVMSDTASSVATQESSEEGTGGWTSIFEISNADQLPLAFGGAYDFEYDHAVYWPEITSV
ncbi:CRAL-TRIO domain-containing protein [Chytriomyces sp. MP71]|nr:CRAL-TRIO domain-containing protein [Chytriomyces sp. MP71]